MGLFLEFGRPAYDALFETIVKVSSQRRGEVAVALMLIKRAAQQLDAERPYEAIRSVGRAFISLYKDKAGKIIEALYICGSAYERVGLLWAARGTLLVGASIAISEFWSHSENSPRSRQFASRR